MKVLVTGGGGFLGQAIVQQLRARDASVRSMSRQRHAALDGHQVEQVQGDLRDARAVHDAVSGCDAVMHVAAKAGSWGRSCDFHDINVGGTEHVIAACQQQGIRHLVYTSTPSVVSSARDLEGVDESHPIPEHHHADYPASKSIAEAKVRSVSEVDGLATVSLRPHLIWGPGDTQLLPRLVDRAESGRLRRVGHGRNVVDITYIDDAARAHLAALDALMGSPSERARVSGQVYFISSGQPIALWDMVDHMLAVAGLGPCRRSVPRWAAYAAGAIAEFAYRGLGKTEEPLMTRWVATELATSHWFDISAARRDFGYEPRIELEAGLAALSEWYDGQQKQAPGDARS